MIEPTKPTIGPLAYFRVYQGERCIYKQVSSYLDGILSRQQCGIRKSFSAQHSLLKLFEKNCRATLLKSQFGMGVLL